MHKIKGLKIVESVLKKTEEPCGYVDKANLIQSK